MSWLKTGICDRIPVKWSVMLIVSAQISFLRQVTFYEFSFARWPPWISLIGSSCALRGVDEEAYLVVRRFFSNCILQKCCQLFVKAKQIIAHWTGNTFSAEWWAQKWKIQNVRVKAGRYKKRNICSFIAQLTHDAEPYFSGVSLNSKLLWCEGKAILFLKRIIM